LAATVLSGSAIGGAAPLDVASPSTVKKLWVARYNGRGREDTVTALALTRDGKKLVVTGTSGGGRRSTGDDFASVAYNSATGKKLWVARYMSRGNSNDSAASVGASPDGKTFFVAGTSSEKNDAGGEVGRCVTIAYNAATGAEKWLSRYGGTGPGRAGARSLAVSPNGSKVFVTVGTGGDGYVTIAYDARTGAQQWVARFAPEGANYVGALAVSPDGARVFVTGTSRWDYATVAYSAATGSQLWVARYDGPGRPIEDDEDADYDQANALSVSGDGVKVFVTGMSDGGKSGYDYGTVAYAAATGKVLWTARYTGHASGEDSASSLVPSRDGRSVYVFGTSVGRATSAADYAAVAYSAATGRTLWAARYDGPSNYSDYGHAIVVDRSGKQLFVTGASAGHRGWDYATIAFASRTGKRLWVARYGGPKTGWEAGVALAVGRDNTKLFVTGTSDWSTARSDFATVAYDIRSASAFSPRARRP